MMTCTWNGYVTRSGWLGTSGTAITNAGTRSDPANLPGERASCVNDSIVPRTVDMVKEEGYHRAERWVEITIGEYENDSEAKQRCSNPGS